MYNTIDLFSNPSTIIREMSLELDINTLTRESKQTIHTDLEIKMVNKFNPNDTRYIYPYTIVNNKLLVPFAYASQKLKLKRPKRKNFSVMNVHFEGTLREEQRILLTEAIQQLNKTGSVIISAYCGFGKTCSSIHLACSIRFKTLVIVNKIVLMKQWEESILKFCPNAMVQRLTVKSKKQDCDFYIMNAQNVEKMGPGFFSDIGTVIVDEAHLIMAETLSRSMNYLFPRYLIGLTATPYRPDGLNNLLEYYFGDVKLIRKLYKKHIVYKFDTNFKPVVETAMNGRINWNTLLESQAMDPERNQLIINILRYFKDRKFLVLTKRVAQAKYLTKTLVEAGEHAVSLVGNKQNFESSCRILIGTSNKLGVGFDHPGLDALLLASDVEQYFIQYLGRVFRTKEVEPIIIDLVDEYSTLKKHWNTRRKVYMECGGKIKTIKYDVRSNSFM